MLFTLAKWGVKLGFKSVKYSYKGVKYGTKVYKARKRKQTASKSANEELSSSNSSFDSGTSGGEWQPQGQPPSTFSSGSEKLQTNKSRNAAQPSNELQELQMNKHRKWITNVIKNAIGFGSAQPRTSGAVAIALVEQAAQGCSLGVMWGDLCRISVKFFGWHSISTWTILTLLEMVYADCNAQSYQLEAC